MSGGCRHPSTAWAVIGLAWGCAMLAPPQARAESPELLELLQAPERVIGLELIVAEGSTQRLYSRFGHALLRLVDDDGDWTNDLVLSLLADNSETGTYSVWRGLFGGYEMVARIETLDEVYDRYVTDERRSLARYIIPSSPVLRESLLRVLVERQSQGGGDLGSYRFLTRNCSSALAGLLKEAGFPLYLNYYTVPVELPRYLLAVTPLQSIVAHTIAPLLTRLSSALGVDTDSVEHGKDWPDDSSTRIIQTFQGREIQRLLMEHPGVPDSVRERLVEHVRSTESIRLGLDFVDDGLGMAPAPLDLYSLCSTRECAVKLARIETDFFGEQGAYEGMRFRELVRRTRFPKKLLKSQTPAGDVIRHVRLLLEQDWIRLAERRRTR